jgi:hypothetical protein
MTKETDAQWESAKARMTGECTCNREHWQPHAESCPAYKPKPLLTVENIRSGAVPSDAHAVGFLLGEIEKLDERLETQKGVIANYVEGERILRGNLSLAEEGLATYALEVERLRTIVNGCPVCAELAANIKPALEPCEQRCEFVGMYDIQCALKAGHEGKHKIFGPYGLGASRDASSEKDK